MANKKSGLKWKTSACASGGETYEGYSGKYDAAGTEYVVCQNTNKQINVPGHSYVLQPKEEI